MKSFINRLEFECKPTFTVPQNGGEIIANVVFEARKYVDDFIVKELYEKYKDTPISQIYVLDETEFEKFLQIMLPKYAMLKGEEE